MIFNYIRLFVWIFGFSVLIDLILVFTGHTSISMATWIQTQLHPTLIAAGTLGMTYIGYLVRTCWKTVLLSGALLGHLFIHW